VAEGEDSSGSADRESAGDEFRRNGFVPYGTALGHVLRANPGMPEAEARAELLEACRSEAVRVVAARSLTRQPDARQANAPALSFDARQLDASWRLKSDLDRVFPGRPADEPGGDARPHRGSDVTTPTREARTRRFGAPDWKMFSWIIGLSHIASISFAHDCLPCPSDGQGLLTFACMVCRLRAVRSRAGRQRRPKWSRRSTSFGYRSPRRDYPRGGGVRSPVLLCP
jgi:hypothetical protein